MTVAPAGPSGTPATAPRRVPSWLYIAGLVVLALVGVVLLVSALTKAYRDTAPRPTTTVTPTATVTLTPTPVTMTPTLTDPEKVRATVGAQLTPGVETQVAMTLTAFAPTQPTSTQTPLPTATLQVAISTSKVKITVIQCGACQAGSCPTPQAGQSSPMQCPSIPLPPEGEMICGAPGAQIGACVYFDTREWVWKQDP